MTRRKVLLLTMAVVGLLAVLGIVWFEPQALFIDDEVDEAPPSAVVVEASPREEVATSTAPESAEPEIVAAGDLRGVEGHDVRGGTAQLFKRPDGSHVLRLDDLDAQNGPDLKVYLSAAPGDADADAHDDDYVSLGGLKGNVGSSNYEIPGDVDLDRFRSAVIWCERFSVGFAVADLGPPQ